MNKYWHSLHFRYTVSVAVLIVLIFSGTYFAYSTFSEARTKTSTHLKNNQELSDNARKIRISVLDSYTYIDAYLLEPAYKEYKQHALNSIHTAISSSKDMLEEVSTMVRIDTIAIEQLTFLLNELKVQTEKLFLSREDSYRQYPSLAVGNDVMQPNRNAFNNAIAVALNEMRQEKKDRNSPGVYQEFIQTRHLWTQVLSNFRLYLANRMGSFDESSLPVQEKAIETMYQQLLKQLQKLAALDQMGELGFESGAAVQDMIKAGNGWFNGFKQVKKIHNADGWRIDSKIMKEDIVPLINRMSNLLLQVESQINHAVEEDMKSLVTAAHKQTNMLIWGAGAVLLFVLIIYVSTNRLVFRPIATVVKALKAEAIGKDGVLLPSVRSRETTALVDAFNEMAKRVHQRQSDLEHQALHDSLTALPNRTLLQDRMAYHIQSARREHRHLSLLMIDLNRFKEINDTLGHHIGDQVLIEVGHRISSQLREVDTIARLGGDEFAVVLPDADKEQAKLVCKKLLQAMQTVLEIDELHLYVGMSIGISSYPEHGIDVTTLIQHADVAMYVAKQNQLGCAIYDATKDEYSLGRLELINDLKEAIDNDNLSVQYQPSINMGSDEVKGIETLLRWNHPEYGILPPDQVIDLAEQTGLINPLTYWVIENALKQTTRLFEKGYELEVSVNISVYNLKDKHFVENIKEIISRYPIPTEKIILEITESAMMANPVRAAEILSELDEMGLRLAIDDFGTGFSSLAYLKQLPVDELKIDKSFIIGMKENSSDEVIVHSTIDMAHNLGLEVVAEGVETKEIYNHLKDFKCDTAQGYYMSKPLPLDLLEIWLDNFGVSQSFDDVLG
ncbi:MAG: EAL domain-containing protein [Gammaproteobacteria bacterium]